MKLQKHVTGSFLKGGASSFSKNVEQFPNIFYIKSTHTDTQHTYHSS